MKTCINLKETFDRRYKVTFEESSEAERPEFRAAEAPWLMIIPCRFGQRRREGSLRGVDTTTAPCLGRHARRSFSIRPVKEFMMFLNLELSDLAWVLEYVADDDDCDDDDTTDTVVRAAKRLIAELKDQLDSDQIAEIDRRLKAIRAIRWTEDLWREPTREAVTA